ncbi:hypothetical protein [Ectopseudomonas khazarica]|uniref:hypothetical protein n=1 Tax=Ectopseudomonas khazarica TaxID=2502979 RepID=UPI0037C9994E
MKITVDLEIFSPRWGHEDTYTVQLTRDFMEIKMPPRVSRATWIENQDPEWSGESIQRIMNNDNIYPPEITQDLFEHVWKEWRNGDINDQQAEAELQEIAKWINAVTRAKPDTEFWNKYF